jgi:hypothetical protein
VFVILVIFNYIWDLVLLQNEGLSRDVMVGFLLALISNDRPIYEVLNPNFLDQTKAMDHQFSGMSADNFDYDDFEQTRIELVKSVNNNLLTEDKKFLLSVKNLTPDWSIHDFANFPAVRWKLQNLETLRRSNPKKYQQQLDLLQNHLKICNFS